MYAPKFTITSKLLRDIGLIEGAKAVIESAALLPAWEARFKEDAELRSVHYGTHVEGNELNLEEVKKVMEGKEVVARERDIKEVINYRKVLEFLDSLGQGNQGKRGNWGLYGEEILRKLHHLTVAGIVPPEEVGKYRGVQVVLRDVLTGEIVHRPPISVEVPFLMEEFFEWLSGASARELHPIIKAGIVHYAIVNVHPFTEGNGRVSRSMATLILLNEGYDIRKLFSLEEHYDKNVGAYYFAIKTADQNPEHDLTAWLEYFVEGVAIELNKVKERVRRISLDARVKDKLGEQVTLNERQMIVMEYLHRHKEMQNKDFRKIFPDFSDDTVLREIKFLKAKGLVKKVGGTKMAKYVLK